MTVLADSAGSGAHGTYSPAQTGLSIPHLWSGKLLVKFYAASVVTAISNTEYEGEIKNQGDTVNIRRTPDITIGDYTKGLGLTIENPAPDTIVLEISHGKYWAFLSEDVDEHQSDYDRKADWSGDAAEQMKITVDTQVLAATPATAATGNYGSTAGVISGSVDLGTTAQWVQLTKANILDVIVDCGVVLDEQNVPEAGRFVVMPAWACGMIKKSDLQDASLAGDSTSILRNGRIGMIDRFELYRSNLLTDTTDEAAEVTSCLFGQKTGLTFAGQFVKNESVRSTATFGTINRGLKVYGFKTVKPEAIGHLYASAAVNV